MTRPSSSPIPTWPTWLRLSQTVIIALGLILTCCWGLAQADIGPESPPLTRPMVVPQRSLAAIPVLTDTAALTSGLLSRIRPVLAAISTARATVSMTPTEKIKRYLLVDQDAQSMRVYENGAEVRVIPVSTGRPLKNSLTPAWTGAVGPYWGSGTFVSGRRADYIWYLFPGKWGSILIHSVPYTQTDDLKLYDRLEALGVEPVSLGCVRISPEDAAWLKEWDPIDVPITITAWSGSIGPADPALPPVEDD